MVWAVINGETETGVSLFYIGEGMDDGDIIASSRFTIGKHDTISQVADKAVESSVSIFTEYYPRLLRGDAPRKPQSNDECSYCAQRIPEDGKINWNWPLQRVYNFVRAQSRPYPGAFTVLNGKKLTIWTASPMEEIFYGTPGQVVRISAEGVVVICGDNRAITIKTAQLQDDQTSATQDIIRTHSTRFIC